MKKERPKNTVKEHKASWQETYASIDDIMTFLDNHVMLRHNVVTGRVEYRFPTTYYNKTPTEWQPISDRVVNSLWTDMARGHPVRIQDIQRVIESDYVPDYDPFKFYMDDLPLWNEDKDDYIMELAMSVIVKGEAEEQMLFCQCLKKWLVGMVACWLDPKVVNNVILVLVGEQGSYKTTWFSCLLPPELRAYFRIKTNASRMTKDDLLSLTQYGLVCYEELDTMGNRELNELKSAVTMPSIDERPAYGRYHEHRRHLASFCGTGNNVQFLNDPTGNRRWLPFQVDTIMSPRMFPFNYEGIYSQARRLYRDGFQYWFSQDEIQRLNSHNRQFETPRLETELVDVYFRKPNEYETGEFMPVARAMQIIGGNTTQKLSPVMIGRAFTELGYECRRTNHSRGYIVVQRSALEIKERMKDMAVTGDG